MSDKNKVNVVIGGEIITLVSAENEEYMHKLALYVERKLSEIKSMKSNASINERTRTLFITINIADDYFKTLGKLRRLEEEHHKFVTELGRMQEENYLLTERLHDLQDQLNVARAELSVYSDKNSEASGESKNIVNLKQRASGGGKRG